MLARRETTVQEGSLAEMLDRFYLYCAEDKKPSTAAWYKKYLEDFLSYLESKRIRTDQFEPQKLRPKDVRSWVNDRGTAKRARITTIKAAYSWGYEEGWITSNPIGGMKRGKEKKRKQVIPVADMRRILRLTSDRCFRELLIFSWDTGARPQEITKLSSNQVEISKHRCVLEVEDSKGERFCLVIYLTPRAERIIARNSVDHDGIVFRNTDGNPWTANTVRSRFRRLTDKVGTRYRQYDFRHTFATRMVKAGVSPIVVGELLGHEDTSTLAKVYQHVAQDPTHLLEALNS